MFYHLQCLVFVHAIVVFVQETQSFILMQVFKALYENGCNSFHVNAHLAILAAIRDVCKLVVKELTSWVSELELCFCQKKCILMQ